MGLDIIKDEPEVDHKWKKYFIKKKIAPTLMFLAVTLAYNLYGYLSVKTPVDCMYYWVGSTQIQKLGIEFIKILIYIGPAATTLFFYQTTLPHFRRSTPTNSLYQELLT